LKTNGVKKEKREKENGPEPLPGWEWRGRKESHGGNTKREK